MNSPTTASVELAAPSWLPIVDETVGRERLLAAWENQTLADLAVALLAELRSCPDMTEFSEGSYRRAFGWGEVVVKAPIGHERIRGLDEYDDLIRCQQTALSCWSSLYEFSCTEPDAAPGPVAPCRLVWHESGLPIVIMERVLTRDEMLEGEDGWPRETPHPLIASVPDWAEMIDGEQVGWSPSQGSWVIYDSGCVPCRQTTPQPSWWPA